MWQKLKMFLVNYVLPPKLLVAVLRLKNKLAPIFGLAGSPRQWSGPFGENIDEALAEVNFSEEWELFRSEVKRCLEYERLRYAEIGTGASCLYVAQFAQMSIVSVESDQNWARLMQEACKNLRNVSIVAIDMGPCEGWGRPISYALRENFDGYYGGPFRTPFPGSMHGDPDLLLVDGRFRVASILHALLTGQPGLRIVVDDYVRRAHYHIVEEVLPPTAVGSRQAVFEVPSTLENRKLAEDLFEGFKYVMD